jgi:hypothetical protein
MRGFLPGLTVALTLGLAGLVADVSVLQTTAVASGPLDTAGYLGRWNYNQPDRDSGTNIAELGCPAAEPDCPSPFPSAPAGSTIQLPQIGDIVFSQ